MHKRSMERPRQALEKVAAAVKDGRLKAPTNIGALHQWALSQHYGYRYYSWEAPKRGQFQSCSARSLQGPGTGCTAAASGGWINQSLAFRARIWCTTRDPSLKESNWWAMPILRAYDLPKCSRSRSRNGSYLVEMVS